jgi:hypothetical protein
MDQIKKKILEKHPETMTKLDTSHDIDFGYISETDKVSFRVNGAWTL